jgi:ribosomal protein L37E
MTLLKEFQCKKCGGSKFEIIVSGKVCESCCVKSANRAREIHFKKLEDLTLENRVKRIEQTLYDLKIDKRLKSLEAKNIIY